VRAYSVLEFDMLKALAFMLLMISYKPAFADVILNPEKQVLICIYAATDYERITGAVNTYNEHHIRMNWSDWHNEKKYIIKNKIYKLSFTAQVNYLHPDQTYEVHYDFRYELAGWQAGYRSLAPDMTENVDHSEQILHRMMYIDVSAPESEIPSICRKNFQHLVTRAFQLGLKKKPH
jgi:hypothetical protein